MPILDLQQRMMEKGRIRLGHKVTGTTKAGKNYTRPAKLETFKLTSSDEATVHDAADLYGGQVEPFNAGEYGVVTDTVALNVILVPGEMGWSQWREMWGNKVCHRRCDGVRETISDGPCQCPADPAERAAQAAQGKACKDTTRLSVMLPDLPGLGLWRLESHGYYAATELAGTIAILSMLAPGTLVRGRLLAEQRSVTRIAPDGTVKTNNFVVPVLDLPDVRLSELVAPDGGVGVQLEAPTRRGLTPVPVAELPEGPRPSIAEQVAAVPEKPKPRKNAAAPLPATGLRPRKMSGGGDAGTVPPAGVASPGVSAPDPEAPATTVEPATLPGGEVGTAPPDGTAPVGGENVTGGGEGGRKAPSAAATAVSPKKDPPEVRARPSGDTPATLKEQDNKRYQSLNRFCRAVAGGWDEDVRTPRWEALAYQVSGARTTHLGELTAEEAQQFRARIEDGAKGRAHWIESDAPEHLGWTLEAGS